MLRLLLVPLEDVVVFPNMNVTLTVDVGDEERVLSQGLYDLRMRFVEVAKER